MKTNATIVQNSSESSLEVNFGEIFKIKNILIGFMLLIGNFFKDKHLLRYALVLAGLLATTILAPLLSAYPEFFGVWEYVIRVLFTFPLIYLILIKFFPDIFPYTFQIMKNVVKNSKGFQKYQDTLLILAILQFHFFILVCIGILAHETLFNLHLLLWLGLLTIEIFRKQE